LGRAASSPPSSHWFADRLAELQGGQVATAEVQDQLEAVRLLDGAEVGAQDVGDLERHVAGGMYSPPS
jgi:hypothetical protein